MLHIFIVCELEQRKGQVYYKSQATVYPLGKKVCPNGVYQFFCGNAQTPKIDYCHSIGKMDIDTFGYIHACGTGLCFSTTVISIVVLPFRLDARGPSFGFAIYWLRLLDL